MPRDDNTAYFIQTIEWTFCVPVGYDGVVISIMNDDAKQKVEDGIKTVEDALLYMTDENTINFRLM